MSLIEFHRVEVRSQRSMRGPVSLVVLLGSLFGTLFGTSAWAESVRMLASNRDAIEARVALALEAEEEILVQSFILGDDDFTETSLAVLRAAARRGVSVKLLVDAQWNKVPQAALAHLREEGVEIRVFHPFRLHKLHWVTRRMHDKMILADGRRMILGGRNLESPYFGFGHQLGRRDYLDLDLEIVGDVASKARSYFLELWESHQVEAYERYALVLDRQAAERELDRHEAWLLEKIELKGISEYRGGPQFEVDEVAFFHDPVGEKGKRPGTGHALLEVLDRACESVIVESPYLVPTKAFREGVERAVKRGVRLRILTNSLATTDNLLPQAGYVGQRKALVGLGVELWEYAGTESLHSKVAVIDGRWVVVGSFNLDPRSEFLNTELAVLVDDQDLAQRITALLENHLILSWTLDEEGRPIGEDSAFPGVSQSKVWKLRFLQLLAPLIRKQL